MTVPCTLFIRTEKFKLELEGTADFVRASYRAVRDQVLSHLEDTLEPLTQTPAAQTDHQRTPHKVPEPPAESSSNEYVWAYRCGRLYNKVHVIQRTALVDNGLARLINPWRLARIYFETEDTNAFAKLLPVGKTLWSELTALGRRRLRQE